MQQTNVVVLQGYVGKKPETYKGDKSSVTTFSLANSESYKNKAGEWVNKSYWFDIVTFGTYGEQVISKIIEKGDQVIVTGRLTTKSYTDKEGKNRVQVQVVAVDVSKIKTEKSEKAEAKKTEAAKAPEGFPDDHIESPYDEEFDAETEFEDELANPFA